VKELRLEPGLAELLGRVRSGKTVVRSYGVEHGVAWPVAERELRRVLDRAGVSIAMQPGFLAFGRELVKHCRTKRGAELAAGIEVSIRKWRDYGLDLPMLCRLAQTGIECFLRFRPDLPAPASKKKPRRARQKRSYAEAVEEGSAAQAHPDLRERQVRKHAEASERSRELARQVGEVLDESGVPRAKFIRYHSFALRVNRHAGRYGEKMLLKTSAGCVEEWEAKGADRGVLVRILRAVFGIEVPRAE